MNFTVEGKPAFAYTAAHELDAAKPTVVFVHGAGLDHSSFGLQSRYFGYHGWNVLALDLPGHGRSEGPPLPSIGEMADWVVEVLNNLKIQKAVLVGHSMGSLIALECGGAPSAARRENRPHRRRLPDEGDRAVPRRGPAQRSCGVRHGHHLGARGAGAARRRTRTRACGCTATTLARLRRLAPGVLHNDLKASNDFVFSGTLQCPVLFVLGKRDVMTPPRAAQALLDKLSNSKVEIAELSGHGLMGEVPDATLDALVAFLRR